MTGHIGLKFFYPLSVKKRTVILKFRELRVMLVHMSVIYVDNISHFELSVCF